RSPCALTGIHFRPPRRHRFLRRGLFLEQWQPAVHHARRSSPSDSTHYPRPRRHFAVQRAARPFFPQSRLTRFFSKLLSAPVAESCFQPHGGCDNFRSGWILLCRSRTCHSTCPPGSLHLIPPRHPFLAR